MINFKDKAILLFVFRTVRNYVRGEFCRKFYRNLVGKISVIENSIKYS
jgi:hypothetical protein